MNQNQLEALRARIIQDIAPLATDTTAQGDASERFSVLLRVIQAGASTQDIYNAAYAAARRIVNKDERLSALLTLLEEVDFDAGQSSEDISDQQETASSFEGAEAEQSNEHEPNTEAL